MKICDDRKNLVFDGWTLGTVLEYVDEQFGVIAKSHDGYYNLIPLDSCDGTEVQTTNWETLRTLIRDIKDVYPNAHKISFVGEIID